MTGSVATVLPVPLQFQYWNNASTFVLNADDDRVACDGTEVLITDVSLNADISTSDGLQAGETSVVSANPNTGYYLIGLSAPGYDGSGNPEFTLKSALDGNVSKCRLAFTTTTTTTF